MIAWFARCVVDGYSLVVGGWLWVCFGFASSMFSYAGGLDGLVGFVGLTVYGCLLCTVADVV